MKIWKKATESVMGAAVLSALGCGLFLSGCTRQGDLVAQQPQPQPQPTQVVQQPQQPQQVVQEQPQIVEPPPQYIIVQQAPPAIIVERRPPPPVGTFIWIDGSWNWNNQRYVWETGRYAAPPQVGAIWIAPRYDTDPHGYRYTPGQWHRSEPDNNRGGRGRRGDR